MCGSILLHRPDGASVDLARLHPRSRAIRAVRGREIAMIFQEPMSSLSPVHTVGDQITEVLRLHLRMGKAAARARCVELLRQVEIPAPELAVDRYTFQLSGGMRQRVMIAMSLACNPSLLIADEPTTALDVTTQAEILDLIRRLQASHGMAVMFITHDMGVVAEIAARRSRHASRQGDGERLGRRHLPRAGQRLHADADRLRAEAGAQGRDPPEAPSSRGRRPAGPARSQARDEFRPDARRSRACPSMSDPARRSASSASPGPARRRWDAACCGSTIPTVGRSSIAAPTGASSTS